MKIVIPDDYQHAVQSLDCFQLLNGFEVQIYHDSATGLDELVRRFAGAGALVLTRERTRITEDLLARLPSTGSPITATPSPFAAKVIAGASVERRSPATCQPRPLSPDFLVYQPRLAPLTGKHPAAHAR